MGDFVSVDAARYWHGDCMVSFVTGKGSATLTYPAVTCSHLSNLAGVVAVLLSENVSWEKIKEGIASFPGIRRRLERIGSLGRAQIYSDYAHHSTAVAETLAVCRKIWPAARIGVLFEPHERLRTSRLQEAYAGAFKSADAVGLLPVYDPIGRERKDIGDNACSILADNIVQIADYDAGFAWIQKFAQDSANKEAIIIVMGAGPVDSQIRKRMAQISSVLLV
jgi:UDP-N-acetylmuramate-alanine ligase